MAFKQQNEEKKMAPLLTMPSIALGTWKLHKHKLEKTIKMAIKMGYRHIDTAKLYHNEKAIGKVLDDCFKNGLISRDKIWITSKLWNTDHNPKFVISALQQQLKSLKLEYLDLYLIHSPIAFFHDIDKPYNLFPKHNIKDKFNIIDTWNMMEKAVEMGLVKYIGLSNFNIKQCKRILNKCKIRPFCLQCECHPYLTQLELIEFCKQENIKFVSYSPFGSLDYIIKKKDINIKQVSPIYNNKVLQIAKECSIKYNKNISSAKVLLRFHIERQCNVIAKATSHNHLIQNLDIFDWSLNDKQMKILLSLNKNWRAITMEKNINHREYPF